LGKSLLGYSSFQPDAMSARSCVAWLLATTLINTGVSGTAVSPVQKVLQLLDECTAKIKKDLGVEQAAMEEYMLFNHKELTDKAYAIKSSSRDIEDLTATIAENQAIIAESGQEITDLGTRISEKENELSTATTNRESQHANFKAAEGELLDAVGETERAVAQLKQGMSFAQLGQGSFEGVKFALQKIIDSVAVIADAPKERLQSFMQSTAGETDELVVSFKTALRQPEEKAFESKSGAILETVEEMQDKAEKQLGELRTKEMQNNHEFEMLADSLNTEISEAKDKLAAAQALKASCEEKLAQAQEDLGATEKTKADDEAYSHTVKQESQMKAQEFEERMVSAKGELGAIAKARDILENGVVALVQSGAKRTLQLGRSSDDDRRLRAATKLRDLGRQYHKITFMELATAVSSDPFVKIRGLIEDMIAKLMAEAAEEASQKAFCDQEMGKSNAAKKIKETKMEKHQTRMDQASADIAELTSAVKRLEKEVAEIDGSMAEATAFRTKEKSENTQAMSDFRQSADAVIAAIATLRSFYDGTSFLQTSSTNRASQPDFASSKGDAASGIIGVLEVAESDFTELFAETESSEQVAADAFAKLSQENKIARAQKQLDAKGKRSEIKSLEVSLSHNTEDHAAVSAELDAVNAYLDKLKPECETKVMSYGERKAAREAEIEGLKDAMSILQGN